MTAGTGTPTTPTAWVAGLGHDHGASPSPRWNEELERRLRIARMLLEEHQKRWSERQEEFLEEVRRLFIF